MTCRMPGITRMVALGVLAATGPAACGHRSTGSSPIADCPVAGAEFGKRPIDSTCGAAPSGADLAWHVIDIAPSPVVMDIPGGFAAAGDGTIGIVGLAVGAPQSLQPLPIGFGVARIGDTRLGNATWQEFSLEPGPCGASMLPGIAFSAGEFAITSNQPFAPDRQAHLVRTNVAGYVVCDACLPKHGPALPFARNGQLWLVDAVPPLPSTTLRMALVGLQCDEPAAGVQVGLPVPASSAVRPTEAACNVEACAFAVTTALSASGPGSSGVYALADVGTLAWAWTSPPKVWPPSVRWQADGSGWIVAWKGVTTTGWSLQRIRVAGEPPYVQESLASVAVSDSIGHTSHQIALAPDGRLCVQLPYQTDDLDAEDVHIGCFGEDGQLQGTLQLRLPKGDRIVVGGYFDGRWVWYVDVTGTTTRSARIFVGPADGTPGLGLVLGTSPGVP